MRSALSDSEVIEVETSDAESRTSNPNRRQTRQLGIRSRDELPASSLGCGNDLVEALITAQRIPARIKAEVGYDGTAGIFATFIAAA